MSKILEFPLQSSFGDLLENVVSSGADPNTVLRLCYQRKTDPLWAQEQPEQPMRHLAEVLLKRELYPMALSVFKINASIDPKSLPPAIESVEAARKVRPNDPKLDELFKSLRAFAAGLVKDN
jgi:hypothetical protein